MTALTLAGDPATTCVSPDLVALQRIEAELNVELLEREDAIRAALLALLSQSHLVLLGPPGCQPAGSLVMLADGAWAKIEDIKPGDEVLSPQHDGTVVPVRVTDTFSFENRAIYRLATRGRKSRGYLCSHNHVLPMQVLERPGPHATRKRRTTQIDMTLDNFLARGREFRNKARIFSTPAYDLPTQMLPIDPYVLGCMIGDGSFGTCHSGLRFSTNDPEIVERMCNSGARFNGPYSKKNTTCKEYDAAGEFRKRLKASPLYGCNSFTKFIPDEYMRGDLGQRLQLLAGLVDTDGTAEYYCTVSATLARQFEQLIFSIGGWASISEQVTSYDGRSFRLSRSTTRSASMPYRLS